MKILHAIDLLAGCKKKSTITVTIACFLCLLSCKKNSYPDEHPAFVNAVYKRLNTAQNLHIDESLAFIDSTYNALEKPSTGDLFIKDSIKSIKYRLVKNEYLTAVLLLDSIMDLIRERTSEEKYAVRYAATLYQKGKCFANMKRYSEALQYFSLAEDATFHFVKNKCSLINYSGSKAYLLFAQEKYLEAAAAFLQQSRVFLYDCAHTDVSSVIDLQRNQNNIALSYLRAGLPDSAIFYQSVALRTINMAGGEQYCKQCY